MSQNSSRSVKGTYYIRVRATGWFVWYKYYEDGNAKREPVDKKAVRDIGFKEHWSVDEAKAHCSQLNKERSLLREKVRKAAKRVTELKSVNEALFPQSRIDEFKTLLEDENFGSAEYLEKLYSHYNFIQSMCNELKIQPVEYKENAKKIYKYFIKKKISVNYSGRIISLLNRWGRFVSKANGSFFENVPIPKGRELSAIADAQQTKSGKDTELGVRTESAPLLPATLENAKSKLIIEQYNWLKISVWFGLRPEEVEGLRNDKNFRVEYNIKKKIYVLHVYQPKLQSVSSDKRWKAIPVLFDEQKECIEIIKEGAFKKPLYKTMRKHIGGGITLYGGRKGFTDLMMGLEQKFEDVSIWLGHKNINTTWKHYKEKQEIRYTETSRIKGSKA